MKKTHLTKHPKDYFFFLFFAIIFYLVPANISSHASLDPLLGFVICRPAGEEWAWLPSLALPTSLRVVGVAAGLSPAHPLLRRTLLKPNTFSGAHWECMSHGRGTLFHFLLVPCALSMCPDTGHASFSSGRISGRVLASWFHYIVAQGVC